jgi:hypothetical protein
LGTHFYLITINKKKEDKEMYNQFDNGDFASEDWIIGQSINLPDTDSIQEEDNNGIQELLDSIYNAKLDRINAVITREQFQFDKLESFFI